MPTPCAFDPSRRLAIAGALVGAGGLTLSPGRAQERGSLPLPAPRRGGGMPLAEALQRRRSVRRFAQRPLALAELSQLLWAAQGVSAPGRRTAPSAGALYPLELLLIARQVEGLAGGAYRFQPEAQTLQRSEAAVTTADLQRAALGQAAVTEAAAAVVLTAVAVRSAGKYAARSARYIAFEAGAAAQNLALQSVALGLGSVVIGGFDDVALATLLQLPAGEQPLCLLAIGALP